MKRTTLILNETNLKALKRIAADEGRTLTDVVDEIFRQAIAQRRAAGRSTRRKFRLPSFRTGTATIDIADRDQLYDVFDRDRE